MRKLIVPKSRKTVKRREDSKTHKSVEELASQVELIAPLTWAQRLKRVFERVTASQSLKHSRINSQINFARNKNLLCDQPARL
jgi:hypothetical protein